jgi:hypothetical protein
VDLPTPPAALAALAGFVRQRLTEVQGTLSRSTARQVAMVIVGAAAPFATNSYARTRLLRQMHAAGLLTDTEAARADRVLSVSE